MRKTGVDESMLISIVHRRATYDNRLHLSRFQPGVHGRRGIGGEQRHIDPATRQIARAAMCSTLSMTATPVTGTHGCQRGRSAPEYSAPTRSSVPMSGRDGFVDHGRMRALAGQMPVTRWARNRVPAVFRPLVQAQVRRRDQLPQAASRTPPLLTSKSSRNWPRGKAAGRIIGEQALVVSAAAGDAPSPRRAGALDSRLGKARATAPALTTMRNTETARERLLGPGATGVHIEGRHVSICERRFWERSQ